MAETSGRVMAGRMAKDLDSGIALFGFNSRHWVLLTMRLRQVALTSLL